MDKRVYNCLIQLRTVAKREIIDKLIDYKKQGIDVLEGITEKGLYLEEEDYNDIRRAVNDYKAGKEVVLTKAKHFPTEAVKIGVETPKPKPPTIIEKIVEAIKTPISKIPYLTPIINTVVNTASASATITTVKKK